MVEQAGLALSWFHDRENFKFAGVSECADVTDEEVPIRIEGFQTGYDKEYYRPRGGHPLLEWRYDWTALPFWIQRALVERWEKLHRDFLKAHPEYHFHPLDGYVLG